LNHQNAASLEQVLKDESPCGVAESLQRLESSFMQTFFECMTPIVDSKDLERKLYLAKTQILETKRHYFA